MKTSHAPWLIRATFAIMASALAFAWMTNTAIAQESSGSSVSIAPAGQTIVKNASVVSVSPGVIRAEASWGATRITFLVHVTGSTRFVPDMNSRDAMAAIKAGQTISFTGTLGFSNQRPTVAASVVQNNTLIQESVSLDGIVASVNADTGTFAVRADSSDPVTVVVPSGALMSRDGNRASVSDSIEGDKVRIVGRYDSVQGILTASRVTLKSNPTVVQSTDQPTAAGEERGIFASIVGWFMESRGSLTVR